MMDAVFDAGPLIYLDAVGYMEAARVLYGIVIPDAVARELERRPGSSGGAVPAMDGVEIRVPDESHIRRVERGSPFVDAGERAVIAVALELGVPAVIDERRGRLRARMLGVALTGAIGVLIKIHQTGHAHRTFTEDLDALNEAGMYIGDGLKRRVMERYREIIGDAP
ncbi:MAG: hypothetical protein ACRDSJ_12190 [Rubrobacteraceae bacterium]